MFSKKARLPKASKKLSVFQKFQIEAPMQRKLKGGGTTITTGNDFIIEVVVNI